MHWFRVILEVKKVSNLTRNLNKLFMNYTG